MIGEWLDELAQQFGADFLLESIKEAMALIMRNNIFGWGSLHFLQLLGTAMGTSAAVMWTTIYYGVPREAHAHPQIRSTPPLLQEVY